MFFDEIANIQEIAKKHGTSVFVLPDTTPINIKNAIVLKPETKSVITIEQVRDTLARLSLKQTSDQFIIFRPADKMQIETANTILKNLEEPGPKVHFILITENPSQILPTIISRSAIYIWRNSSALSLDIKQKEEIKDLAKRLIVAKDRDLIKIMNEIAKHKTKPKDYVLEILATAIEMLYKGFLINQKPILIKKLPKFLLAYENISANGNIKLHLVADLC